MAWTGDTAHVEVEGDLARALAGGKAGKDLADDRGFGLVDDPAAADRAAVSAISRRTCSRSTDRRRSALLDPAFEAAAGLVSEVLEKQGIHAALEPDMQFTVLAFGQRDDPDPGRFP